MKRHQVMDLWHGNYTEPVGEWIKVEDNLPNPISRGCKVRVKLIDQSETFAYYYQDMTGVFFDCRTKEPLDNVIEWKKLTEVSNLSND